MKFFYFFQFYNLASYSPSVNATISNLYASNVSNNDNNNNCNIKNIASSSSSQGVMPRKKLHIIAVHNNNYLRHDRHNSHNNHNSSPSTWDRSSSLATSSNSLFSGNMRGNKKKPKKKMQPL